MSKNWKADFQEQFDSLLEAIYMRSLFSWIRGWLGCFIQRHTIVVDSVVSGIAFWRCKYCGIDNYREHP